MRRELTIALRMTAVTLVLTGLAYPLLTTGVAQLLFPRRAAGSFVEDGAGQVIGSELIGQPFARAIYLQPRPSAAGEGWDAASSGGSNLGPTSRKLRERAQAEIERLRRENPGAPGEIPAELVTTSGSGLDPDLSPAGALWQVRRIAAARKIDPSRVEAVVRAGEMGRTLGFLGEPSVNVLALNLALDRQFGAPPKASVPDAPAAP